MNIICTDFEDYYSDYSIDFNMLYIAFQHGLGLLKHADGQLQKHGPK